MNSLQIDMVEACSSSSTLIVCSPGQGRRFVGARMIVDKTLVVVHSVESGERWVSEIRKAGNECELYVYFYGDVVYANVMVVVSVSVGRLDVGKFNKVIVDMAHLYDKSVFGAIKGIGKTVMFAYHDGVLTDGFEVKRFEKKIKCVVKRYAMELGMRPGLSILTEYEQELEVCSNGKRLQKLVEVVRGLLGDGKRVIVYVGHACIKKIVESRVDGVGLVVNEYYGGGGVDAIVLYTPIVKNIRMLLNKIEDDGTVIEFYDKDRSIRKFVTSRVSLYKELGFDK